jgi:hypothetical protein
LHHFLDNNRTQSLENKIKISWVHSLDWNRNLHSNSLKSFRVKDTTLAGEKDMSRSVEQISNTEALCCSAALHLIISGNKQEKEDEKALEQQPSIECAFQLVQGNKETIHEIDDFGSFLLQFSLPILYKV